MNDLNALLHPKSVAIIGASTSSEKVGSIVVKNIIESNFQGNIYPVNPKAENIHGLKCYQNIKDLPEVPDLVIVSIPSKIIISVLEEVGEKGTKNLVVFTAGFKEIGNEGQALEKNLISLVKKYGFNLLGPNCMGFVNNLHPINATFGQVVNNPGNLHFISQSGAIASSIFDLCEATTLGFGHFITLGNKSTLNQNHFLKYWIDNPPSLSFKSEESGLSGVQPIGMYLESIEDGKKFLKLTKKISKTNPLFLLKPGKSEAAQKAMQSHTGAMAGEDDVLEAALNQSGVIRCDGVEDIFDFARAFSWENPPEGPGVAVVSNAGGPAVISADILSEYGLELADFDEKTHKQLLEHLPRAASSLNPVDVLGDALAERYKDAINIVLSEDHVHSLMVILTPQVMTQIEKTAQIVADSSKKYGKPIVCSFIGGSHISSGEKILNHHKIPSFRYPERAIKALAAMWKWKSNQLKSEGTAFSAPKPNTKVSNIVKQGLSENRESLNNFESNQILSLSEISTPKTTQAPTYEMARDFAQENGYPIVVKLSSPKLLHKTEVGGIFTNIYSDSDLGSTYDDIYHDRLPNLSSKIRSDIAIQVQSQVQKGVEVIIGVKKDPSFGPVLMFGAGGTTTELIKDKNLHILPIDHEQAVEMIKQSKIFKLLNGFRGEKPYNIDRLADVCVKLGNLSLTQPSINEIEINPVIVTHEGIWAVDGKTTLVKNE
ncbi:acetate--CoA ligase family protein [Patescibacteria group bacterium]